MIGSHRMNGGDRYWDSSAFLAWMNKEDDHTSCEAVLKAAEEGQLKIITSAVTLTEVIKYRGAPRIDKQKQAAIQSFFGQPYIEVRDADRYIAERARDLMWDHEHLDTMDAIHLATALLMSVRIVESVDKDFLRLDKMIGQPPMEILRPGRKMQVPLL